MSEVYMIKHIKAKTWQITKFSDYKEPDSSFQVSERAGHYHCTCPGYHRQKNKEEHKHILAVKYWRNQLFEQEGAALWFDNDKIESNIFIPQNTKLKQILTCS